MLVGLLQSRVVSLGITALSTFAAMRLGHFAGQISDISEQGYLTPIWPATGVNIGLLLIFGLRAWPGILLGSLACNALVFGDWRIMLAGAPADVIEAVVAAWLMLRIAGATAPLLATRRAALSLVAAGIVGPAIGVAIGFSLFLALGVPPTQSGRYWEFAALWYVGDALAAVAVTPVVITAFEQKPIPWTTHRRLQGALITLGLTFISCAIFLEPLPAAWLHPQPLVFLTLPFIVWASLGFGGWGASASTLLVVCISIGGTLAGRGPFGEMPAPDSLVQLQIYLGVTAVMSLLLGASTCARAAAHRELSQQHDRLQQLFSEVDHRVRNNLASLLELVRLASRSPANPTSTPLATFEARVRAMSKAHSILSGRHWNPARLSEIVLGVVASEQPAADRLTFTGDDPSIPAEFCQAMSLALHELAANARQHGAWSRDSGGVEMLVDATPASMTLKWSEHGGPVLVKPPKEGTGLGLVRGFITHELKGTLGVKFADGGLEAVISVPLEVR